MIAAAEPGEVVMLTENMVYDFTEIGTSSIKIEKTLEAQGYKNNAEVTEHVN